MIPADAEWLEERNEFRVCQKVDGRLHGECRYYRPDGTLACVSGFVDGLGQGPYERFHPDGTVSQRGSQLDDKLHGDLSWHRPAGESPENTVPPVCPPSIRETRARFEHGLPWPVKFYLGDGTEVLHTGDPLPPRPAGVDPVANFDPTDRRWYLGLGSQGHEQRHGWWRWWSEAGDLLTATWYHRGAEREVVTWEGTTRNRKVKGPRVVLLEERFVDGVPVDSHGAPLPTRPGTVPEDARFDVSTGDWVHGPDLDPPEEDDEPEPVEGLYTWWGPTGLRVREYLFAGGVRIAERRHYDSGALMRETLYSGAGKETCESWFRPDGSLKSRMEQRWDGETLQSVLIRKNGEKRAVGVAGDDGMQWVFSEDEKVTATGTIRDHRAVGPWTFFEGHRRFDLELDGLRARVDADFHPSWLLGARLLEQEGGGQRVAELRGVDDIAWGSLSGAYNDNVVRFPLLLQALTSSVRAVRRTALGRIGGEIEHQGSIYPATAAVVPWLLRLLDHPNADAGAILGQVLYVAQWARPDEDEDDGEEDDEDIGEDDEDEEEDDEDFSEYARVPEDILRAVEEGFDRIAACLESERDTVLSLARYGGPAGVRLLREAASGTDPELAAIAVHGLIASDASPEEVVGWLAHPDPLVRLCTALAAAHRFGPDTPEGALVPLTEALEADPALTRRFYLLPFTDGTMLANTAVAISLIRSPAAMALAGKLSERLEGRDLFTLDSLTAALLLLCFGDGNPPYAPGFVEVIERMAACRGLVGFANFSRTCREWNLPSDLEALHALGGELRVHPDPAARMRTQMLG